MQRVWPRGSSGAILDTGVPLASTGRSVADDASAARRTPSRRPPGVHKAAARAGHASRPCITAREPRVGRSRRRDRLARAWREWWLRPRPHGGRDHGSQAMLEGRRHERAASSGEHGDEGRGSRPQLDVTRAPGRPPMEGKEGAVARPGHRGALRSGAHPRACRDIQPRTSRAWACGSVGASSSSSPCADARLSTAIERGPRPGAMLGSPHAIASRDTAPRLQPRENP